MEEEAKYVLVLCLNVGALVEEFVDEAELTGFGRPVEGGLATLREGIERAEPDKVRVRAYHVAAR
jgi:hypothetical protein